MPLIRTPLPGPFFDGFPAQPVSVVIDAGGNGVHGVRLEFEGDHDTWDDVRARGLFHHSDEICGPVFGGAFRIDLPFLFTVELAPERAAVVAALASSPDAAKDIVAQAPAGSPLRDPASYRLLSVMQQRTPKAQWGLTTTFFKESVR